NNLVWNQSGASNACNNACTVGKTDVNNASRTGDTFTLLASPLAILAPVAQTITDWDLNAASTIKSGPVSPYVIRDFAHRLRPASSSAIGAMDPKGGSVPSTPSTPPTTPPATPTPPVPPVLLP